ncbi:VWA domain-containing protein [Vibrio sp. FNV 38]|nr:VWA domain-containing protein [Vibrio sp. FNV 38]
MTFLYPQWLWALLPCALITVFLLYRTKNKPLIAPHIAKAMGLEHNTNHRVLSLLSLAWLLAIIALTGPSINGKTHPSTQANEARVVVMDMSLSMYARDVAPSRLEQARFKVNDLLNLWQDGQTGLVVYAGDAYSVAPLTRDTQTLLNHLPQLSPEIMPYPGAQADKGVEQAITMLTHAGFNSGQIIMVVDDLSSSEREAIETQLDGRWQLAILGVATENGAPIPLPQGGMLKNSAGSTVVATSQFTNMSGLARSAGGLFIPIQHDNRDVEAIAALSEFMPDTFKGDQQREIQTWQNQGYWLVIPLVLLALLMFRRGVMFSLTFGLLFTQIPDVNANPWLNHDQQGYKAFAAEDFKQAQTLFEDREWQGLSAYQSGDYQSAIELLSDPKTPQAQYNLGNAYAQAGQLEEAKLQYEQVLAKDPANLDAQHNLALVNEKLQQQPPQQSESSEQGDQSEQQDQSESQDQPQSSDQSNDEQQGNENQDQQSQPDQQSDSPSTEQQQSSTQQEQDSEQNGEASSDPQNEPDTASSQQDEQVQEQPQSTNPSEVQDPQQNDALSAESQPVAQSEQDMQKERDLKKLDRVEAARDPSRLIRAQLQLQAQQKPQPNVTEKSW